MITEMTSNPSPCAAYKLRTQLEAGELLRLESAIDITLSCTAGQLWVTSSLAPQDWCLHAGERRERCRGVLLIEGPGALEVRHTQPASNAFSLYQLGTLSTASF